MLLGTLGASLLTGRGLFRAGKGMYRSGNQGQGLFKAGQGIKTKSRIQSYDSIMCGYLCILFIEYMLNNKTLTDFTNLFSPWNFEKNEQIIKRYFK